MRSAGTAEICRNVHFLVGPGDDIFVRRGDAFSFIQHSALSYIYEDGFADRLREIHVSGNYEFYSLDYMTYQQQLEYTVGHLPHNDTGDNSACKRYHK